MTTLACLPAFPPLLAIAAADDVPKGPNVGDFGNLSSISNRAAASSIAVVVGDKGEDKGEVKGEDGTGEWAVLYVKCWGEMDAAPACALYAVDVGPLGRGTDAVMVGVPNGLGGPTDDDDDDDDSCLIGCGCRFAGGVEVTSIRVVVAVGAAASVNAALLLLLRYASCCIEAGHSILMCLACARGCTQIRGAGAGEGT